MCDYCSSLKLEGEGTFGRIMVDPHDPNQVIKCQSSDNESVDRELFMYYHLDHPNIPKIKDVNIVKSRCKEYIHFTMKKYTTLSKNDLTIENKRKIFLDLVDVVAYLQSRNMYHQDIRPENIVLDSDMKPYLIDYGMTCDTFCCKSYYTSPDILDSDQPSLKMFMKGDSWSLGLLGLHLFCEEDIYQWAYDHFSVPCALKGKFLHLKKSDVSTVPSDILQVIKALLRGKFITTKYQKDPLDFETFNRSNQRETIMLYYNPPIETSERKENISDLISRLRNYPTETKDDMINVIRTVIDMERWQKIKREERVDMIHFLYDYLLPLAVNKFGKGPSIDRFWDVCIRKLEEFEHEPELKGWVKTKLPELKSILGMVHF